MNINCIFSPEYLVSLVPPTVGSLTSYPLRNATNIQTIYSASQSYYNSFLLCVIRDWNDLSEEVRNSATISTFKCKLNSNIKSPPKYYFRGTRIGQIYHSRLRTNCSSLNQHYTFLSSAHLCFIIVFICDLFVSRDDPLMS